MSSNANANKGKRTVTRYSHKDVVAEGANKDVEFQRAITTIEALQSSKGSYLIAKGALDKADAAFLIEEDAKRKHSERAVEERERRAFLEARKLAMEKEEAEIESDMNEASKRWGRVGIQGEKNKNKKVQLVHRLKKRRLQGGDGDFGGDEDTIYEKKQEQSLRGGTGDKVGAEHGDENGMQLQSLLGGYGSSSSGESDDDNDNHHYNGGNGDDKNAVKLPSARDLI